MVLDWFRGRIFPTKDATKRGTTASSDEKRQGLSNAKNNLCNREDIRCVPKCSRVSTDSGWELLFISTGNKTSLRSLGCHPLVLLLQGAWANWPMSWLRWHRYLLRICSQAGWALGDKRPNLGISDWYGWKSFLVSIQEISAPHDPLIQWSWLQCGKFLGLGRAMQMLDRWWFNSSDREQKLGMA